MALNPFYRQNAWDIFEDPFFHHGKYEENYKINIAILSDR